MAKPLNPDSLKDLDDKESKTKSLEKKENIKAANNMTLYISEYFKTIKIYSLNITRISPFQESIVSVSDFFLRDLRFNEDQANYVNQGIALTFIQLANFTGLTKVASRSLENQIPEVFNKYNFFIYFVSLEQAINIFEIIKERFNTEEFNSLKFTNTDDDSTNFSVIYNILLEVNKLKLEKPLDINAAQNLVRHVTKAFGFQEFIANILSKN